MGYFVSGAKCISCNEFGVNCDACTVDGCTNCDSHRHNILDNGMCVVCPIYCTSCVNGKCQTCEDGYKNNEGICE